MKRHDAAGALSQTKLLAPVAAASHQSADPDCRGCDKRWTIPAVGRCPGCQRPRSASVRHFSSADALAAKMTNVAPQSELRLTVVGVGTRIAGAVVTAGAFFLPAGQLPPQGVETALSGCLGASGPTGTLSRRQAALFCSCAAPDGDGVGKHAPPRLCRDCTVHSAVLGARVSFYSGGTAVKRGDA